MKSTSEVKKPAPILQIHESTLPALSEVERIFLDRFVNDGRAVIVKDKAEVR